jgi:anti-anti-sigma factor
VPFGLVNTHVDVVMALVTPRIRLTLSVPIRAARPATQSAAAAEEKRGPLMDHGTDSVVGLSISSRSERGCVVAALKGELDSACAPFLREQLVRLLRPGASRMVIDMSQVSCTDASGLAVLVGTGRRAGLLGGWLRLAALTPAVAKVMRITGLHRQLDVFRSVQAAILSTEGLRRQPDGKSDSLAGMSIAHRGQADRLPAQVPRQRLAADAVNSARPGGLVVK